MGVESNRCIGAAIGNGYRDAAFMLLSLRMPTMRAIVGRMRRHRRDHREEEGGLVAVG
jgi:hypothetical protein